ncbi:GOLPH3/VPS74 family protein [Saccharopolyspora sp. NPDC002376]
MDLPLSEQFVLLGHKPTGGRVRWAVNYAGAAELADFLLWKRINFTGWKIRVINAAPTGSAWFDGGLALLSQRAGAKGKPVPVLKYLQDRGPLSGSKTCAFATHRDALARRDLLRCGQKRLLGVIPRARWYPSPAAWNAVLNELRAFARGELPPEGRLVLLAALVHSTGLHQKLALTTPERKQLKQISQSTALGQAVRAVINAQAAAV